ncbi:hypothetical protein DYI37_14955 [Fulvimarina endophytica]|uniref:Glycosyltransferase RgtA/B/C/D-like domain-containing protein n=1 Tax=Fulvimarina endophytica TaxID=2293836 RepID=A0A371X002_9HYPH|nr:hypothetical protein [Fulvimarina endophytica]RFC62549.1 hypothetical protein DYI37_14955 [Fulvimarina endophytica]
MKMIEANSTKRPRIRNARGLYARCREWKAHGRPFRDLIGLTALVCVTGMLFYRATEGVDLSDESYYALFLHDWIFGGIAESQLRSLHQTAAFVIYPVVIVYEEIVGSFDGLFLFLRFLYVTGAVLSAISITAALIYNRFGARSWLAGLIILAFIPYGLPAPSYNTLGLQGFAIGISGYAIWATSRRHRWTLMSAVGWAIAIVSYPPLAAALVSFLGMIVIAERHSPRSSIIHILTICSVVFSAAALCAYVLTPGRLIESYAYLSLINDSTGISARLQSIQSIISNSTHFYIFALISFAIGAIRRIVPPIVFFGYVAATVAATFFYGPALFVGSHDLILFTCIAGMAIVADLWSDDRCRRSVAMAYVTSIVAGCLTSAFATHTLYSFPIGGAVAAAISATWSPRRYEDQISALAPGAALMVALVVTSLSFRYGETPITKAEAREPIETGIFAGLSVAQSDAEIIRATEESLKEIMAPGETIAAIGRLPGLMLLSEAPISMLTPFPLMPNVSSEGLRFTKSHYRQEDNLPTVLLIFNDVYFAPVNFLDDQMHRYEILRDLSFSSERKLRIYRLRQPGMDGTQEG